MQILGSQVNQLRGQGRGAKIKKKQKGIQGALQVAGISKGPVGKAGAVRRAEKLIPADSTGRVYG